MTVFKTYLKILKKNIFMVLVYTVILILFGALNMTQQENSLAFNSVKPDVIIVNNDEYKGITKGFIDYIKENSNTPSVKDNEEARSDALFYNDADFIIYIPKNFNKDFMNNKIDSVDVKMGNNFNASYSKMMINRYLKVASVYRTKIQDQDELRKVVKKALKNDTKTKITTKLDTDKLSGISFFFNFESYALLVSLIFIISLIQSVFNEEKIRKRNVISSIDYKKNNNILLFSNLLYAFTLWFIYLILGIIILGDALWTTTNGLFIILNSFVHSIMVTSLAFLIGNIVTNKNAINGITNVIGIGTSFMCGVFVPLEYLPDSVINIAHILPTYYYVKSNEIIITLEEFNFTTLKPVLFNMSILLISTIIFIILSYIMSNKRRKID